MGDQAFSRTSKPEARQMPRMNARAGGYAGNQSKALAQGLADRDPNAQSTRGGIPGLGWFRPRPGVQTEPTLPASPSPVNPPLPSKSRPSHTGEVPGVLAPPSKSHPSHTGGVPGVSGAPAQSPPQPAPQVPVSRSSLFNPDGTPNMQAMAAARAQGPAQFANRGAPNLSVSQQEIAAARAANPQFANLPDSAFIRAGEGQPVTLDSQAYLQGYLNPQLNPAQQTDLFQKGISPSADWALKTGDGFTGERNGQFFVNGHPMALNTSRNSFRR